MNGWTDLFTLSHDQVNSPQGFTHVRVELEVVAVVVVVVGGGGGVKERAVIKIK